MPQESIVVFGLSVTLAYVYAFPSRRAVAMARKLHDHEIALAQEANEAGIGG